jgi:putative spermidine/putrescine transport system permease protein
MTVAPPPPAPPPPAPARAPAHRREPEPRLHLSHRLAERGVDRTLLLLVPGVVFLIALFIYPLMYGLGLSFQPIKGTDPLANYRNFFTDHLQRDTIGTTLRISLPPALFNVLVSVPIAYRMRGRMRGKRLLTTVLVIPITLGTVLTAEGMLKFFDTSGGWFNQTLKALHLVSADGVALTGNYWGVVISLVISGFPFAFLLILSYLSGIDPSLEAAASTLGASPRERFWRITFPLLAPGLAITFCLTFVLAFSVFPSAYLVGNPTSTTRVISIAAYEARSVESNDSKASTIALIMAVIELVVISIVLYGRGRLYRGATGGKG